MQALDFCSVLEFFFPLFLYPHQVPEAKVSQPEVKEEVAPPTPTPAKEEPAVSAPAVSAPPEPKPPSSPPSLPDGGDQTAELKNHEPHLGPKPRSHNRVLNPPGGKSSVVFY